VKRLLQDPRVRATIDMQDHSYACTALHFACHHHNETNTRATVTLLLEAGANPILANNNGEMPLDRLRSNHPTYHSTIALLKQALGNAETTSLLVKARRLAVAVRSNFATPSYLQCRVDRGQPTPHLELTPVESDEEGRKFRSVMAFLLGMGGGPDGVGMPRDVFRVVLDLLTLPWDPLIKRGGVGPPLQA